LLNLTDLGLKAPVTKARLTTHIFVCTGKSCTENNSQATLERFWELLSTKGLLYGKRGTLDGSVIVTTCGSVGLCSVGPAVLVYPEGVWYYGVTEAEVEEIVEEHIINGRIVERLLALQF